MIRFTLTATGTPGDYTLAVKDEIAASIASRLSGVSAGDVAVTVTAAPAGRRRLQSTSPSVIIAIEITSDSASSAAVATAVSTFTSDAAAAQALLSGVTSISITVLAVTTAEGDVNDEGSLDGMSIDAGSGSDDFGSGGLVDSGQIDTGTSNDEGSGDGVSIDAGSGSDDLGSGGGVDGRQLQAMTAAGASEAPTIFDDLPMSSTNSSEAAPAIFYYVPASDSRVAHCKPCSASTRIDLVINAVTLVGAALVVGLLLLAYRRYAPKRIRARMHALLDHLVQVLNIKTKLKITYGFYVIVTRIESVYRVVLPDVVRDALNAVSKLVSFGFDFMVTTPPACMGIEGYLQTLQFAMTLPVLLCGLVVGYTSLRLAWHGGSREYDKTFDKRRASHAEEEPGLRRR